MRLLIDFDNESIFLPPIPISDSELDPTSDLQQFRQWLHNYQPGFRDLTESEQQQQTRYYYDQYTVSGRLPLLPVQTSTLQIAQFTRPNAKIKALVHNLGVRSAKAFLYDSAQTDWTSWVRQTISELVRSNKIDLVVADYLTYPMIDRINKLIGMYWLHQGLWLQTLQYALYNHEFPESQVRTICDGIQESIGNNHRYIRIFQEPTLIEELFRHLEPHINQDTTETRDQIRRSIRVGCQRETLVEMIYTRLGVAIQSTIGTWSSTYTHHGSPKLDDTQLDSRTEWEDHIVEEESLSQRRLCNFETMTTLEKMEWYMRVFMPKITREFYTAIPEVVQYIWHPEELENLANRKSKLVKGRCTSKDFLNPRGYPLNPNL